jgi:hypothetical protein
MPIYPSWNVGDIVTADGLNSMSPDYTIKGGTLIRASTATPADDPDLVTPVLAAGAFYEVIFNVRYATTLAAGFQARWTVPSGILSAGRTIQALGKTGTTGAIDNTPSGTAFSTLSRVSGYPTVVAMGSRDDVTLSVVVIETALVQMGTTAGTIAYAWSQVVSTAVNTAVQVSSYVKTTRVG